jgi:hypothetical protein
MAKRSGLGNNMELIWAVLSQRVTRPQRCTRASSGPPVRLRSLAPTEAAAVRRRHLSHYPVVTGEHAPYLRPPPSRVRQATAAPAAPPSPPLPAAGELAPLFFPCIPTVLSSSLAPVEACVATRCPALLLPRRSSSPLATAARPRGSGARVGRPLQSILGDPLEGPAPLIG